MTDHHPAGDPATDPLRQAAREGCAESRLAVTRRSLMGISAGLFSWAFAPRWAEASAAAASDPRLLVVILRGGMDGLSTVVPFGDPWYAKMRGRIAIPKSRLIGLNSFFGLHPAMPTFGKLFNAKMASVVHACCVPLRNRSHFDCQDNLESGLPDMASFPTGWLNRLLQALPAGAPIRSKGAIEIGDAPLILRGPAPVLGWSPTWLSHVNPATTEAIRLVYKAHDPEMLEVLDRGLLADKLAEANGGGSDDNLSTLRKSFRGAGRLLGAGGGPRIAALAIDGWDTHASQGGVEGELADRLTDLDDGIADFRETVGGAWKQSVVVIVTEFGRTVRVNGDSGTDHGVGTVTLLAGGAVAGGRVVADWPGLAPEKLYEDSDLKPTVDMRSIFKGILGDHLGVPDKLLDEAVFPDSRGIKPLTGLVASHDAAAATLAAEPLLLPSARMPTAIGRYRAGLGTTG